MAKPKTELERLCPSPPYTRWDQRENPDLLGDARSRFSQGSIMGKRPPPPLIGWHQRKKSVLRGELIRDGRSTRVDFETADVARAVALMRLFVRHELDNGRLRRRSVWPNCGTIRAMSSMIFAQPCGQLHRHGGAHEAGRGSNPQ
jgi:hypothetical protein